MMISRGVLLAKLNEASIGLSNKEILEQSNAFVFKNGVLTTFNDDIMCKVESPLDFNAVVAAADFLDYIGKVPDEQLEISREGNEVVIKGKKRKAGITCSTDVLLPIESVPAPTDWKRIEDGTPNALQQAARTCGKDETQYLTTCVHVTADYVEASDNYRFLRVDGATGFPDRVLIPASSVEKLEGLEIKKVSVGKGWVHFRTASKATISVRCDHQAYHKGVEKLLAMEEAEDLTLPSVLGEMVERAEVFTGAHYNDTVEVRIGDSELTIEARKDTGWSRERKRIAYEGRELTFRIHPKFLVEILKRTRDVKVDDRKIKIEVGNIHFVTSLSMKKEKVDEEKPKKVPKDDHVDLGEREFSEADIPF